MHRASFAFRCVDIQDRCLQKRLDRMDVALRTFCYHIASRTKVAANLAAKKIRIARSWRMYWARTVAVTLWSARQILAWQFQKNRRNTLEGSIRGEDVQCIEHILLFAASIFKIVACKSDRTVWLWLLEHFVTTLQAEPRLQPNRLRKNTNCESRCI